jgi:Escherichia/Staphylococcus phage prohead protease
MAAKNGGPIRSHSTSISESSWNGTRAETNLGDAGASALRRAHAWADPEGDPDEKGTYKFIHHQVSSDGKVGPANVRAAISGIGVLNGGRGGANVPERDRKGIYAHLARHLRDAGHEPPELKK